MSDGFKPQRMTAKMAGIKIKKRAAAKRFKIGAARRAEGKA
jgi:hypothetical protein